MAELPEEYCEKMRILLGEEYGEYLESFSVAPHTAYRVNTWKISLDKWRDFRLSARQGNKEDGLFSGGRVPWCEKGFYYDGEKVSPAKHPLYYAGLYYIQEPSAMIPAAILPVEPGDMVLDLCAAPGGKATELGSRLGGTGFLVANDVSASRTMALTKNLQMAGIANVLVTAETPERLAEVFSSAFDKILVDAPCSGEGMFRREPRMMGDWQEKGPEVYAPLQREILAQAYRMLKPGGRLVYSTCTFSVVEDEEVVSWFLKTYPDMYICRVETREGFSPGRTDMLEHPGAGLESCVRIFPHRAQGEGHFAVLLGKRSERVLPEKTLQDDSCILGNEGRPGEASEAGNGYKKVRGIDLLRGDKRLEKKLGEAWGDVEDFLEQIMLPEGTFTYERDTLFWHSYQEPEYKGLRVMYGGLPVCRWRHKVQPSPQLALILQAEDYDNVLSFQCGEEQVIRYLKGETLQVAEGIKGNVLVCLEGYGLGWAQGNGRGLLKNKYHPGWRYQ